MLSMNHLALADDVRDDAVIQINNLVVRYRRRVAVDGLTLRVPRGTVFGLIGANGAGKTTIIKTLLGFRLPNGGEARILGYDISRDRVPINARIGYVSETNTLYLDMTIPQLCAFFRATAPKWDQSIVDRSLQLFGLPPRALVRRLSKGMRTQLALCLALGGDPDVLILDEPTTGLDPIAHRTFLDVLMAEAAATGKTIFFSSHVLTDVESVADSVGILHAGKLLASGPLDTFKQQHSLLHLSYDEPPTDEVLQAMHRVLGVHRVEREGRNVRVQMSGDVQETLDALRALAIPHLVGISSLSLEDIFLLYVKGANQ